MDVRGLRALICVLVVVATSIAFAPASIAIADAGAQRATLQDEPTSDGEDTNATPELGEADQIHTDVFIAENGSAVVTVDYQFQLTDENRSAEEWEELQANVSNNTDWYVEEERRGWNETLSKGENETGRDMAISNVSISTETDSAPEEIGHVIVTFEWSEFALVELNRIEAGAALSGFTLSDGTTLQLRWPEAYAVYENEGEPQVDPSPADSSELDGAVTWNGEETEFTDDQPRIVLIENGDAATEPSPSEDGPSMPWAIVALALALLAVVGAAGWLIGRNRSGDVGIEAESGTIQRTDGSVEAESNAASGPPPELLSNEERVLRLLEKRGGRVKQQEVVSELEWTEAKTSQVVGELRENDEIDVFRIGRENVLALPDEE
ncbi:helix-turn-helix transcriptional regulator [Natrinema salinisoli]|uniref:helix-turn-helix transcriptional regulator n=1 Tax=Natrinema salinisoli TaxID=2878535 RepID=UPI001CEFF929|nr:hypothetical protein [Natrinema salinisoli]